MLRPGGAPDKKTNSSSSSSSSSSTTKNNISILYTPPAPKSTDHLTTLNTAPFNPNAALPLSAQKQNLPITKHKRQILHALEHFKVVVIVGETGSGKSTQIPQYLYEGGWTNNNYSVVCTQPRRLAAITLAQRVSEESNLALGSTVGYAVRFDEKKSEATKIKFCTDGLLVRECMTDVLLSEYSVVVVDEAHERNLSVDMLLALLKKIRKKRPDLRVVICSATIDAEEFLRFFCGNSSSDGVIISVDGRQHPVETMYLKDAASNYVTSAAETVINVHNDATSSSGDILVFLPTSEDIDNCIALTADNLKNLSKSSSKIVLIPLHASLPVHLQSLAFKKSPPNTRKAIFATTIAETSVTLPGVKYVVDCGFVKMPFYDVKHGVERLVITTTSQASAKQRAGRAGRTSAGKCYRLYTNDAYLTFGKASHPEITRTPLSFFVLTMKALGIDNIMKFDLLSPPSVGSMSLALEELYGLGAIDDDAKLTSGVGDLMAEFPVEPRVAKVLLSSFELGCVEECISIAAVLQVHDIFLYARSVLQKRDRDVAIGSMVDKSGDHVTYASIFERDEWRGGNGNACRELFLNYKALSRADEIRKQLRGFMRRLRSRSDSSSYGNAPLSSCGTSSSDGIKSILQAVAHGLVFNVARLSSDGRYRTLRGNFVAEISPSSLFAQYGKSSEYVVYNTTEDSPNSGLGLGGGGLLRLSGVSGVPGAFLKGSRTIC